MIELKPQWINDSLRIGNVNVFFPFVRFAISQNKHLSIEERTRHIKAVTQIQDSLNKITCKDIFKEKEGAK